MHSERACEGTLKKKILAIAEQELAFVIGVPEFIGTKTSVRGSAGCWRAHGGIVPRVHNSAGEHILSNGNRKPLSLDSLNTRMRVGYAVNLWQWVEANKSFLGRATLQRNAVVACVGVLKEPPYPWANPLTVSPLLLEEPHLSWSSTISQCHADRGTVAL